MVTSMQAKQAARRLRQDARHALEFERINARYAQARAIDIVRTATPAECAVLDKLEMALLENLRLRAFGLLEGPATPAEIAAIGLQPNLSR